MTAMILRGRTTASTNDGSFAPARKAEADPSRVLTGADRFGNEWGLDPDDPAQAAQIEEKILQLYHPGMSLETFDRLFPRFHFTNPQPGPSRKPAGPLLRFGVAHTYRRPERPDSPVLVLPPKVRADLAHTRVRNAAAFVASEKARLARIAEFDSARLVNTTPEGARHAVYRHPVTGQTIREVYRSGSPGWEGHTADGALIGFAKQRTLAHDMIRARHADLNDIDAAVLERHGIYPDWSVYR